MTNELTTEKTDRSRQLWEHLAGSELSADDKRTLMAFFMELRSIFGPAKYEAQFGKDEDAQLLSIRGWAPMVLEYTDAHLIKILKKVRRGIKPDYWICVPEILTCIDEPWTGEVSRREHLGLTKDAYARRWQKEVGMVEENVERLL